MALPTQKQTKSHRLQRAVHRALKVAPVGVCAKCRKPVLPHQICKFCGTYNGRQALKIKAATDKSGAKPVKSAKATKESK